MTSWVFSPRLEPATDQQKQLITTAMPNFMQVVETTLLMTRQLANPVPKLLLYVVVGWAALLFMSYGLLGGFNALSVAVAALGSIAVASAIYMILEFSQPYSGLFRISPVGVDNLIAVLGSLKARRRSPTTLFGRAKRPGRATGG